MAMKDHLCLALDVPEGLAHDLLNTLEGLVGWVKLGPALLTAPEGYSLVEKALALDYKVFWDQKFKDIPSVVAKAARNLVRLGVSAFTVHADGGLQMLRAVRAAVNDEAGFILGLDEADWPKILAVTVLTSLDGNDLMSVNIHKSLVYQVKTLATMAWTADIDGIVCSAQEVARARETWPGLFLVTPGLRYGNDDVRDQVRVGTPAQAYLDGSDLLVVGSSIITAPDPAERVLEILSSLDPIEEEVA